MALTDDNRQCCLRHGRTMGWFLWLAISALTSSFGLWFVALAKGGATRTSGYLFLAPVVTIALSFLILGTPLHWLQAVGELLIGVTLWLINREKST